MINKLNNEVTISLSVTQSSDRKRACVLLLFVHYCEKNCKFGHFYDFFQTNYLNIDLDLDRSSSDL